MLPARERLAVKGFRSLSARITSRPPRPTAVTRDPGARAWRTMANRLTLNFDNALRSRSLLADAGIGQTVTTEQARSRFGYVTLRNAFGTHGGQTALVT